MTPRNRQVLAAEHLRLGFEALGDARANWSDGRRVTGLSRLYYAVFHALAALLAKGGLRARSHKAVGLLFLRHHVGREGFTRDDMDVFSSLQLLREYADYAGEVGLSDEEFRERAARVEDLMRRVETRGLPAE